MQIEEITYVMTGLSPLWPALTVHMPLLGWLSQSTWLAVAIDLVDRCRLGSYDLVCLLFAMCFAGACSSVSRRSLVPLQAMLALLGSNSWKTCCG
jgi:hypothetical protein